MITKPISFNNDTGMVKRMTEKKETLNCWDYFKCGREPGGDKVDEFGVCAASEDPSFDGINNGKCGGRFCWAVAGTFCDGEKQGSFAKKMKNCAKCDFFKKVQTEEAGKDANLLNLILKNLEKLNSAKIKSRHIKAGERFISQGDEADELYVIQSGSCIIVVEKGEKLHPVSHIGTGGLVGTTGVFLNQKRTAHVVAETDMNLMVIPKDIFDDISKDNPDMLDLLTELVTDIFDTNAPIADKEIGKYTATHIVGRGGYSIVYKGIHRNLNMPVAIKMMRHNLAMDSDFLDAFWNEAKTIAAFNHNNIIKIYDIEEQYRTLFIIMEYLEGESLKKVLERLKVVPEQLAVEYMMQILSALDYAHGLGVIHRDINTVNVFVQNNGVVKVIDFGLACPIGTDDFLEEGTVYYAAPEQLESNNVDQRADIFSLGITAYEIVTGQKPFMDKNIFNVRQMLLEKDIPDPKKLNPTISDDLRDFILKSCKRDPAQRHQTAKEARNALAPLADSLNIPRERAEERHKTTAIYLNYADGQELEFKPLLEKFISDSKKIGIGVKLAELKEI